jgi:nuclear pore complex protein Nup107
MLILDRSASQPSPALLEAPESHDDILYPLREAANRVGREVERFAEVLDEYNPLKARDDAERSDMTLDLIELYHGIATETVDRLRDQHSAERRRQDGASWRKKMRGFITPDVDDEMMEDADEEQDRVSSHSPTTVGDLQRWEEEAQTWDLLSRLVRVQHSSSGSATNAIESVKPINRYSSEREVYDAFLVAEPLALERETVLKWLQDTAESSGEDIDVLVQELQQNAERGDIIAHGWLHTKAAIKNQKRINAWSYALDPNSAEVQRAHLNSTKTEALVTQLDPDSMTRQGRKLQAQDEYFERAIWLGCYELLRRGRSMEDIKEWCRDRTEIWRAVSMSGLPGQDSPGDEASNYASTALWRRMCHALAKRSGIDSYESAVYGILSGDFSSVVPVCQSWNDRLFAHYNCLLRSQFEAYLVSNHQTRASTDILNTFPAFDAQHLHGNNPGIVAKAVIKGLLADSSIKDEAHKPLKVLQGVLISGDLSTFFFNQGLAISKDANNETKSALLPEFDVGPSAQVALAKDVLNDYDSTRVLAHVFLAYKSLGMDLGSGSNLVAMENILVAYIQFLKLAGKQELIPIYAAQLSEDRCYEVLSMTLIDITNPEQRISMIRLMKELGLDTQLFVSSQAQNLFEEFIDDETDEYPADKSFKILKELPRSDMSKSVQPDFIAERVDRNDMLLIRSLEWHLLVDGLWSATFGAGVILYKFFYSKYFEARCLHYKRLTLFRTQQLSCRICPFAMHAKFRNSSEQDSSHSW